MPTDPPTQIDPLVRADIRVFNASELTPRSITGLDPAQPIELPAQATMVVAGGQRNHALEIKVPPPPLEPIRAAIRAASDDLVSFSRNELASFPTDEPVIVESIGSTVDLSAFREVARQVADSNRSLIIIAREDDDE